MAPNQCPIAYHWADDPEESPSHEPWFWSPVVPRDGGDLRDKAFSFCNLIINVGTPVEFTVKRDAEVFDLLGVFNLPAIDFELGRGHLPATGEDNCN